MNNALEGIKNEISNLTQLKLEELSKEKTALIVVDMVKGFYNIGVFASDRTEKTINPIVSLINKLSSNEKVFFVDSHSKDAVEFKCYPEHCIEGTIEEELIEEIKEKSDKNTTIIKKNSINGFHAPEFKKWLEENKQAENFIVVGVCSNICVETFAITLKTYFDQFNIDKSIIVPMNTTETYDLGNHNANLMNLMTFYKLKNNGIKVVKEII